MSMDYDPILYDSDPRSFLKDEVEFYVKLINKFKTKTILELGVGTGRIFSKLLPLVQGAVGIDISETMLYVCRNTCKKYNNYRLYKLSFVDFRLQVTFDLIYFPFNTFQHLLTVEDQTRCLQTIKNHMHNNSRFILDVMNSNNLISSLGEWKQDYLTILQSGTVLKRDQNTLDIDPSTSVVHKKFRYTETIKGGTSKIREFDSLMKITHNKKMLKMIKESGFIVEEIWSDYFFGHDKNTKKMIYCLKNHEV